MEDRVLFYEGKWYMFSNFSAFAVRVDGVLWMTVEHAYQAAKFHEPEIIKRIYEATSAHDSKKIAHQFDDQVRDDWEDIKLYTMEGFVRAKHDQHIYIQEKLIKTGDMEIIENSPVDSFWGRGPDWKGENHLGKIWMKIRDETK